MAAVVLVVLVTAINDWTKERQFRGLQKKLDTDARFSVLRDGHIHQLPVAELVVGDIAKFTYGNTFPVDGILIHVGFSADRPAFHSWTNVLTAYPAFCIIRE